MKRSNVSVCRELRKNQTDAEKKLWAVLRSRQLAGIKFRRQFSVGRYILDFYSPEHKLGVEADGGQHFSDGNRKRDELRTEEISKAEIQILRFSDGEILNNIEGVCEEILKAVENHRGGCPPHLDPLPLGRGSSSWR